MKINNLLANAGQPKPNGMDDILYNSGKKGYENCNIANGYSNLFRVVKAWVRDDGVENLINRRRVFIAIMKKMGLGGVDSFALYQNAFGMWNNRNVVYIFRRNCGRRH